jgi:glycosyltransferase involved in cell wall biosynthesis
MINLMTPINQLGYGVAGLNILKALQARTEVALHMIGQPQVTNQTDANAVKKGLEAARFFDPKATCIKIWHQNQMAERIGSGKFIGFPIFELDTFTELEKHHLHACDELFVCSKWAQDVTCRNCCETDLPKKYVHVVPLGVDRTIFKPAPLNARESTIFFNCGKWEVRKGHDILAGAFKEHLKTYPNRVFPSRGEGWNLELLEMMAVGKPTIATNYSAHTEFANKDNCFLIPTHGVEPAFDNKWFFGQGNWAKIEQQDITNTMNEL